MTGLLPLLLILAVTGAAVGEECEGVLADTLGHPTDCRLYYNLYLMSCPDGELYNTQTRRCSPAAESQCGQTTSNTIPTEEPSTSPTATTSTTTGPITSTTTGATTTMGGSSTTTTPGTTTSSGTTVTTTGTATTTTTTGSTTTASSTGSTTESTTAVPTEGSTTPKPSRFECPAVDDPNVKIRYSHDTDCELYYLCVSGTATLYKCTTGNHFSPTRKACRLIDEAACDRCPTSEVARLPHESVCAYYYRCEDGEASLYACPEPLEFSRSERMCVDPEESWCTLEDVVSSTTSASTVPNL